MTTKIRNIPPSKAIQQVFALCLLVAFLGIPVRAQEIRIRVLNGRNGKPITNECLNVWIPNFYGAHIVARTNGEGVVVLHLAEDELVADVACPGWPVRASRPKSADTITVSGDYYVACQEYGKVVPGDAANRDLMKQVMPSYPIKKVLESGLAAGNACGKFRVEAKPGELIFFVRPPTWLEKLKR
jgi:hypothetical protein